MVFLKFFHVLKKVSGNFKNNMEIVKSFSRTLAPVETGCAVVLFTVPKGELVQGSIPRLATATYK